MTITELHKDGYSFFAMEESFDKTNFGWKRVWDIFNIERCMQVNDRLDGHFVTGHIDTIWTITTLQMW
jgi:riboflavin synthase